MEDSLKTLTGVLRYFKDRDIDPMCKITDTIKQQLDQFRPKVPLMVALRFSTLTNNISGRTA